MLNGNTYMLYICTHMSMPPRFFAKNVKPQVVKLRQVTGSFVLTVSKALKESCEQLGKENIYFIGRAEITQDGRVLVIFEEVKP